MTKRDFRHLHERLSRLEDAVGIDDDQLPYPTPLILEPTNDADYGVEITLVGTGNRSSETITLSETEGDALMNPNQTAGEYRTIEEIRVVGDLSAPVGVKLGRGVLKGDVVDVIKPDGELARRS